MLSHGGIDISVACANRKEVSLKYRTWPSSDVGIFFSSVVCTTTAS